MCRCCWNGVNNGSKQDCPHRESNPRHSWLDQWVSLLADWAIGPQVVMRWKNRLRLSSGATKYTLEVHYKSVYGKTSRQDDNVVVKHDVNVADTQAFQLGNNVQVNHGHNKANSQRNSVQVNDSFNMANSQGNNVQVNDGLIMADSLCNNVQVNDSLNMAATMCSWIMVT